MKSTLSACATLLSCALLLAQNPAPALPPDASVQPDAYTAAAQYWQSKALQIDELLKDSGAIQYEKQVLQQWLAEVREKSAILAQAAALNPDQKKQVLDQVEMMKRYVDLREAEYGRAREIRDIAILGQRSNNNLIWEQLNQLPELSGDLYAQSKKVYDAKTKYDATRYTVVARCSQDIQSADIQRSKDEILGKALSLIKEKMPAEYDKLFAQPAAQPAPAAQPPVKP